MKQVTIAGVKQLISEMSKGDVSLREEYVLACLRELVAVVAEMQLLKTAHPQPFGPEMMRALEAYERHQDDVPETGMLNAFFILRDSIRVETPAADALIAEEFEEEPFGTVRRNGDQVVIDVNGDPHIKDGMPVFARQLRESKGAQG